MDKTSSVFPLFFNSNAKSSLETHIGNMFYGTEGYVEINNYIWKAFYKRETTPFAGSKKAEGKKVDVISTEGGESSNYQILSK